MAAAMDQAAVDLVDDLDCDIFDFDVIQALDFDLSSLDDDLDCDIFDFDVIQALDWDLSSSAEVDDESHGTTACCSAIFSDADIVSHCRHGCDDGDDSGAADLCRCLLAGLVGDVDGEEEEEAGSSSPADSCVTDDGSQSLAPPAAGDAAEAMSAYVAQLERFLLDDDDAPCGEQAEEDLLGVVDDYFAGDQLFIATAEVVPAAGRAEPTADDADGEEEENGNVLAAREDQQSSSRKRARNKIKGRIAMLTPWGELEVMNLSLTMTHLARSSAAPWPQALLLCCM